MAAYRLRSFSESESWNIRIECSFSGVYVMGGRPLRGRDRPYYRYTTRAGNREVIESVILRGRPRTASDFASGPSAGPGQVPGKVGRSPWMPPCHGASRSSPRDGARRPDTDPHRET